VPCASGGARTIFATDIVNLYAVGANFAMHESQSRLMENRVGRSRRFWELHFGALRDTFPDQLADVDAAAFWRAVNAVRPGLIRVEADELTYDLHIVMRSGIEAALMAGDLAVADLPAVWAEKMRDYLGLAAPNDTVGVLQDVHWSHGRDIAQRGVSPDGIAEPVDGSTNGVFGPRLADHAVERRAHALWRQQREGRRRTSCATSPRARSMGAPPRQAWAGGRSGSWRR